SSAAIAAPIPRLAPVTMIHPSFMMTSYLPGLDFGSVSFQKASMAELARVGAAALGEGFRKLLGFLGLEIRTQQEIVGYPRQAGNAAVAGVERALDGGEREGAAIGDLEREL